MKYSQGFNPHPKMGFAQPLSLGYASRCELIEFELQQPCDCEEILRRMKSEMPQGIELLSCETLPDEGRSLAAMADSALYKIWIPTELNEEKLKSKLKEYMAQDEIITLKRQKKTKKYEPMNIKHMLRRLEISKLGDFAMIEALLDCGSQSNCSPELVITSFCEFGEIETPRYEIEVERIELHFVNYLQF